MGTWRLLELKSRCLLFCVSARVLTLKSSLVLPKCQVASASSGGHLRLGNQEVALAVELGMKPWDVFVSLQYSDENRVQRLQAP